MLYPFFSSDFFNTCIVLGRTFRCSYLWRKGYYIRYKEDGRRLLIQQQMGNPIELKSNGYL